MGAGGFLEFGVKPKPTMQEGRGKSCLLQADDYHDRNPEEYELPRCQGSGVFVMIDQLVSDVEFVGALSDEDHPRPQGPGQAVRAVDEGAQLRPSGKQGSHGHRVPEPELDPGRGPRTLARGRSLRPSAGVLCEPSVGASRSRAVEAPRGDLEEPTPLQRWPRRPANSRPPGEPRAAERPLQRRGPRRRRHRRGWKRACRRPPCQAKITPSGPDARRNLRSRRPRWGLTEAFVARPPPQPPREGARRRPNLPGRIGGRECR